MIEDRSVGVEHPTLVIGHADVSSNQKRGQGFLVFDRPCRPYLRTPQDLVFCLRERGIRVSPAHAIGAR